MRRGFSWPFIVNVLPLDGLKVSVFLAIGDELNMKSISKWAGRLQTSAQGQFPIIVIYYLGQLGILSGLSSAAIALCIAVAGAQVMGLCENEVEHLTIKWIICTYFAPQ